MTPLARSLVLAVCLVVFFAAIVGLRRREPAGTFVENRSSTAVHRVPLPKASSGEDARDADAADEPWKSVTQPRDFIFPRDHAAHPDYRIEWWYYTGNVATADGRALGFQLTFFRTGVKYRPENPSPWAVRDLYMTHFAVSDVAQRQFHSFQRLNRAGAGWAGALADRYRVWNGNWEVRLEPSGVHRLQAEEEGVRIDLALRSLKPPVVHGEGGISQKGPSRGNASYYYSLTRMATEGTVTVGGRSHAVSGLSWMDHEFSTSFLEPGQQGWDWFAIQLDDGRELMIYRMRQEDGSADRFSSGTLVGRAGETRPIRSEEFQLVPGRRWTSPSSGAVYPVAWQVLVPSCGLRLTAEAAFADQEMRTSETTGIIYWEGSIRVAGFADGAPVAGLGYLEMTGYTGPALGRRFP